MKVNMLKLAGGNLQPLDDLDSDKMIKFKTGEAYEVDVKLTRNPRFHAKVFAFFNFCFAHWRNGNEFQDEQGQFDVFRKNLTCLSGYYNSYHSIKGETRIEAKSLSYGNMTQEEFEQCYNALIRAAIKHLFQDCDSSIENRLMEFF